MSTDEEAQKAITELNDHQMGGPRPDGERGASEAGALGWIRAAAARAAAAIPRRRSEPALVVSDGLSAIVLTGLFCCDGPVPLVVSLVLFLETALIRWLPAYIRLLAYFSNFILLASFLGIGVRAACWPRVDVISFVWFPLSNSP